MKNGEVAKVDGMSVWQNHENRITVMEVNMSNLKGEFQEVKEMIGSGNKKAEDKLDAIDKTLMEEFFTKRRVSHANGWALLLKIGGGLLGGGGIIYAAYDIITKIGG